MIYVASLQLDKSNLLLGYKNILTIHDLFSAITKEDMTELQIKTDFAEKYFIDTGLNSFCESLKAMRPHIKIVLPNSDVFNTDNALQSLFALKSSQDYIEYLLANPTGFARALNVLKDNYLNQTAELLEVNSKMSSLYLQNANTELELTTARDNYRILSNDYNDLNTKLNTLVSRINFNYDKDVDADNMLQVTGSRFDKILYIKEITRIHYLDTFLYYLREQIKILYNVPVRFLVIEPAGAYRRIDMYPGCVSSINLSYSDVMSSDIFMAGFQERLMQDVLQNAANNNYLIILDRSGYHVPHVYGNGVEVIYTVSDLKDATDIPKDRIISYSGETLNIPHITNFDTLTPEDKIQKYSSMSITKSILELIERR